MLITVQWFYDGNCDDDEGVGGLRRMGLEAEY